MVQVNVIQGLILRVTLSLLTKLHHIECERIWRMGGIELTQERV